MTILINTIAFHFVIIIYENIRDYYNGHITNCRFENMTLKLNTLLGVELRDFRDFSYSFRMSLLLCMIDEVQKLVNSILKRVTVGIPFSPLVKFCQSTDADNGRQIGACLLLSSDPREIVAAILSSLDSRLATRKVLIYMFVHKYRKQETNQAKTEYYTSRKMFNTWLHNVNLATISTRG